MNAKLYPVLLLAAFLLIVVMNSFWWPSSNSVPQATQGPPGPRESAEAAAMAATSRVPMLPPHGFLEPLPYGTVIDYVTKAPLPAVSILLETPLSASVQTGPDGTFSLPPDTPPPGSLKLAHVGHIETTVFLPPRLHAPLVLALFPRSSFKVTVTAAQTGKPLPGAELTLHRLSGELLASTRADQNAHAELPFPPLTIDLSSGSSTEVTIAAVSFTVSGQAEGFYPTRRHLTAPDFLSPRTLITLEAALSKNGIVLAPDGRPVPRAHVFWTWRIRKGLASEKNWDDTYADEDGIFKWSGPAVLWETILVAEASGFGPAWAPLLSSELDKTDQIRMTLSEPNELNGRIVDPSGAGVGDVSLKLFRKDPPPCWNNVEFLLSRFKGPGSFSARTDARGEFVIAGPPSGPYTIRCHHPRLCGQVSSENDVTLPSHRPWQGVLSQGQELSGVFITPSGDLLPDAKIYLRVRDPDMPRGTRPVVADHIFYDGRGMFHAFGLEKAPHQINGFAESFTGETLEVESFSGQVVLVLTPKEEPASPGQETLLLIVSSAGTAIDSPWLEVGLAPAGTLTFKRRLSSVNAGNAVVKGLAPGSYDVQISAYGFAPLLLQRIQVPSDAPTAVTLEQAPFVRGKISVTTGGLPRFLDVADIDGRLLHHVPVGQDGCVIIPGLPRGHYRFTSANGKDVTHAIPAPVLVDPEGTLSLELSPVNTEQAE